MDLQKLMDSLNGATRQTRSEYHITLGEMIGILEEVPKDATVTIDGGEVYPSSPHSYRGYYSDLSLSPVSKKTTAGTLLSELNLCLNETFEGYKGGDFEMDEDTPLWVADYGCTGRAVVDVLVGKDVVTLVTKNLD